MKSVIISFLTFILCSAAMTEDRSGFGPIPGQYLTGLPFEMPAVALPNPGPALVSIAEFGAVADGLTMNTKAIEKAIAECAKKGGGRVVIPAGVWLTGPIVFQNNIDLHLDEGALLLFSNRFEDFPLVRRPHPTSKTFRCISPISGYQLENIAITGKGIIDGSGEAWRPRKKEKYTSKEWKEILSSGGVTNPEGTIWHPSAEAMKGETYLRELLKNTKNPTAEEFAVAREFLRPNLLELTGCKKVLLDGPTFQNSPKFAVQPIQCEDVVIRNVTVRNPWNAQNGDGIDIGSCHRVVVYQTSVDVGDDAICLKPGGYDLHPDWKVSTEHIVIQDCVVYHGHGGFVIGSETYGGAKNVAVRNLTLNGTDVGLRFKSSRDRGGHIEKIFINGVQMNDIAAQAILFDTYYEEGNPEINAVKDEAIQKKQDVTARTPFFSDFFISNIVCHGADRAILILGLPEAPVSSIVFNNVVVASDKGVLCVNSRDLTMEKMTIVPKQVPVVALRSATDISILNCILPFPVDLFLTVEGESSSGIQILETDLSRVKTPVKYLVGALETSVVTK